MNSRSLIRLNQRLTTKRIHERTTTAKNMGILKYHPTSLISYEIGWPLACLDGLIKQTRPPIRVPGEHQVFLCQKYLSWL
jgi:hypothetical protein